MLLSLTFSLNWNCFISEPKIYFSRFFPVKSFFLRFLPAPWFPLKYCDSGKMTSIYKTLKRSISSNRNSNLEALTGTNSAASSSSNGAKYAGASNKTWLHPPGTSLKNK